MSVDSDAERIGAAAKRIEDLGEVATLALASIGRGIGPVGQRLASRATLGELGDEREAIADRIEALGHIVADIVEGLAHAQTAVAGLGAIAADLQTLRVTAHDTRN